MRKQMRIQRVIGREIVLVFLFLSISILLSSCISIIDPSSFQFDKCSYSERYFGYIDSTKLLTVMYNENAPSKNKIEILDFSKCKLFGNDFCTSLKFAPNKECVKMKLVIYSSLKLIETDETQEDSIRIKKIIYMDKFKLISLKGKYPIKD